MAPGDTIQADETLCPESTARWDVLVLARARFLFRPNTPGCFLGRSAFQCRPNCCKSLRFKIGLPPHFSLAARGLGPTHFCSEEQDIFARSRFNLGLPIFHTAKVAIPMATSSLGRGFPWKENGLGLLATCQLCLAHPQSRLPTKEGLSWSLGQHSCASCRSVQVCRLDALTRSPARTLLVRHRYGLHCFSKWGRRVVLSTFTQLYTGRGGLASDTDTGLSGCVGSKQV